MTTPTGASGRGYVAAVPDPADRRRPGPAPRPPGWYVEPASGQLRWWDGVEWNDAAAPYQRSGGGPAPVPRRRRPRRRTLVVAGVAAFVLVCLVGGCIAVIERSKRDFREATADLADDLLQPSDLGAGWVALSERSAPAVGPAFAPRARRPGQVCPDALDDMARTVDATTALASRGALASAQGRLMRPATGPGVEFGYVQEDILEFHLEPDVDDPYESYRRAWSCTSEWEYTDIDEQTWRVRNEPIDPKPFGPNLVASRTTFTPADADPAGGEPGSTRGPTEYLNVVSRDANQVLVMSMTGLSLDEAADAYAQALARLVE